MANTFNLGNGSWAQKTEKLLAYNAENDNYKPLPFDFDRGSTATRVNRDGLIETVATDEPRIDFLNNTKGHLLLEPSRSNLVTYSEDFSEWTKQNAGTGTAPIVTSNNTISPDGTQNADKVVFNKGTGTTTADLSILTTSFTSQSNTASIYIKADSPQRIVIRNSSTWVGYDIGTEWTRIEKTDTGGSIQIGLRDGYGIANVPNTATVYLWGAQVEAGSYATSYIPTSGSAVTRSADARTDVALPSSILSQTEGTIFFNINRKGSTGVANQELIVLETPNRSVGGLIRVLTQATKNVIRVLFQINGGIPFDVNVQGIYTPFDTDLKIAIAFKSGQTAIYVNGVSTNTSTSTFTIPEKFDNFYLNFSQEAATFKDVKLYNTRLSNSELQALTT